MNFYIRCPFKWTFRVINLTLPANFAVQFCFQITWTLKSFLFPSSTEQVIGLISHIEAGFERKLKTGAVLIDLTAATTLESTRMRVESTRDFLLCNNDFPEGSLLATILFNLYLFNVSSRMATFIDGDYNRTQPRLKHVFSISVYTRCQPCVGYSIRYNTGSTRWSPQISWTHLRESSVFGAEQ
jgi:hypothetical protein